MSKLIDLVGHRFGRLLVLERVASAARARWVCLCDCGASTAVNAADLRAGNTRSCGCFSRELIRDLNRSHGHAGVNQKNPTYHSWLGMRTRCKPGYHDPAYAGITVCERWQSFENFLTDMGERPEGKTLDRRDNSKGYSPDNCRWATLAEQGNNRRCVRRFDWRGESLTISGIAAKAGISAKLLRNRLNDGWPIERAVSTPGFNRGKRTAYNLALATTP